MTGRHRLARAVLAATAAAGGVAALVALVVLLAPSHPVLIGAVVVVAVVAVFPIAEAAIHNTSRYGPHHGRGPGHHRHGDHGDTDSFPR